MIKAILKFLNRRDVELPRQTIYVDVVQRRGGWAPAWWYDWESRERVWRAGEVCRCSLEAEALTREWLEQLHPEATFEWRPTN